MDLGPWTLKSTSHIKIILSNTSCTIYAKFFIISGAVRNACNILVGNLKERAPLGDLYTDGGGGVMLNGS
jgi:hypothetical protein